jgi:hypothetical protein
MSEGIHAEDIRYSFTEFCAEVCKLRGYMGDKTFWAKPDEIRRKALDAVTFMYMRLDVTEGELNSAADILFGVLDEYERRLELVHKYNLTDHE